MYLPVWEMRPWFWTMVAVVTLMVCVGHADYVSSPPSYDECRSLYGARRYIVPEKMRVPPMLFTFPGSGTTYTQLLVEYATGVYTGSIYDEDELYSVMPGMAFCGQRLGLVKAHTKDVRYTFAVMNGKSRVIGVYHDKKYYHKCHRGSIMNGFERYLITLRDPWNSIWSNYQRAVVFEKEFNKVEDSNMNTHSGKISFDEFNADHFHLKVENSPHWGVKEYIRMWTYCYALLFHQTNLRMKDPAAQEQSGWKLYEHKLEGPAKRMENKTERVEKNTLFVARYEDLSSKNRTLAVETLRGVVKFIGLGMDSSMVDGGNSVDVEYMKNNSLRLDSFASDLSREEEESRRLHCAFVLAENPLVHRSSATTATKVDNATKALVPTRYMTKADAYSGVNHTQWVCSVWKRLRKHVGPQLKEFGYFHGPLTDGPPEGCEDDDREEGEGGKNRELLI